MARKLKDEGIAYKSYWLCGYEITSLLGAFRSAGADIETQKTELEKVFKILNERKEAIDPRVYESLHSFNLCAIDGNYYFSDNLYAAILSDDMRCWGFSNERDGLAWATETLFHQKPYVLREFDPLAAEMGNHILYTLRRLYNLPN